MGMLNKYGHYCGEDSNPQNDKDARVLDELKKWLLKQGMNQDVRALIRVDYVLDKIKELQGE